MKSLVTYYENAAAHEDNALRRREFQSELSRYYHHHARRAHEGQSQYHTLRAVMPKLSRKARGNRYEDLFDELMEWGKKRGENPKEIMTEEDYKEFLTTIMEDRKTGRMTKDGITRLAESLLKTNAAAKILEKEFEEITFRNRERYAGYAKNPDKYAHEAGKKEIYKVLVTRGGTRTITLITKYYDKKSLRNRYRDYNTGRYTKI